jgi:hypothetical protein
METRKHGEEIRERKEGGRDKIYISNADPQDLLPPIRPCFLVSITSQ